MFRLREAHMEKFQEMQWEIFEDRMVAEIALKFHDKYTTLGEPDVRSAISEGVERAAEYGIQAQADVASFIRLQFGLGKNFDRSRKHPWVKETLENRERPPAERLAEIKQRLRREGARQSD